MSFMPSFLKPSTSAKLVDYKSNATNYLVAFLSKKAQVYDPEFVILPSDTESQIVAKKDKKDVVQKILIKNIKDSITAYLNTKSDDKDIQDYVNNKINSRPDTTIENDLITFINSNGDSYKVLIERMAEIENRPQKQGGKRKSMRNRKNRKNKKSRKNRRRHAS